MDLRHLAHVDAVAYASIGIGAALMPRRVVEALDKPVALVPLANPPSFASVLAWSKVHRRGPAAELALDFMRARLPPV